jgi:hypothetical protein
MMVNYLLVRVFFAEPSSITIPYTSGAENDLQHVTEIARHMVLRWGPDQPRRAPGRHSSRLGSFHVVN